MNVLVRVANPMQPTIKEFHVIQEPNGKMNFLIFARLCEYFIFSETEVVGTCCASVPAAFRHAILYGRIHFGKHFTLVHKVLENIDPLTVMTTLMSRQSCCDGNSKVGQC